MGRKNRISMLGRFYHVMVRGNNGENIFFSVQDRCKLSLLLQEGIERFGHRIHAFTFMSNHIHLAIQIGEVPLSKIVHNFTFRYSIYLNRRYNRVGHVFQGRFKSILLDEDGYLIRLVRYIHLNPLRAGLVDHLRDYRWTSHHSYLDCTSNEFVWLTTGFVLNKFGSDYSSAISKYQSYHSQNDDEDTKIFKHGNHEGVILGDGSFIENLQHTYNSATTIVDPGIPISSFIDAACEYFEISHHGLRTEGGHRISRIRAILSLLTNAQQYWTIERLSKELNRDSSTLSNLVRRYQGKETKDKAFAEDLNGFKISWLQKLKNYRPDP